MTTKTIGEILVASVTVESATKKRRQTQNGEIVEWAIRAFVPELGIKDYSTPFSIRADHVPEIIQGDVVRCQLRRGKLQTDRNQVLKSGQYDNQFFWDCVEWATDAPATPAPAPAAPGGGSQDEYRRTKEEMRWTEALGLAAQGLRSGLWQDSEAADPHQWVLTEAAWYYAAIIAGPPQAVPAEAPSVPAQPPAGTEPPRTPAADRQAPSAGSGQALVAASAKQWNDDIRTGSRQGKLIGEKFLHSWVYVKYAWDMKQLTPEQAATVAAAIANGEVK